MNSTGKGGFGERKQHINRKGRPKSFDALRALAQQIAHEIIVDKDGNQMTMTEAIMTKWASSIDAKLQIKFIEYAYGKVPDSVELSGPDGEPLAIILDV
jgi:hypothetical protein